MFILTSLTACGGKQTSQDYNYRIFGKVVTKDGVKDAEWYVDTIQYDADTLFYTNSDSSVVKIYPPYIVKQLK